MAVVITLIVLAALAGAGVWAERARRGRQWAALSPAEQQEILAEREYQERLKGVERDAKAAERAYEKRIDAGARDLCKAQEIGRKKVGSYKGVTAYEDRITTPNGSGDLIGNPVSASVDTAGNISVTKRVTVTRLVAGGIVGGLIFQKKQKHDDRELYLLIESDKFASIVVANPDHAVRVRKFAVDINNATRNAASLKARRERGVSDAEAALELAKAATDGMDSAQRALEVVQAERPGIAESLVIA